MEATTFDSIQLVRANWVSLMPYAFSRPDTTHIWYDEGRQWWGEKTEGVIACIQMAKARNIKVMLKPHLWIRRGSYTGQFGFENPEDWVAWEQNYEKYILHYAHLADSMQVSLFCIGTEWARFVKERPAFWKQLIRKVREIYSGPLTYAANWDAYRRFPFWEDLDYIGVDAYFPLSEAVLPEIDTLLQAWEPAFQTLEQYSQQYQKPILFTEFGYRSVAFAAKRPWESDREAVVNEQAQSRALEALFRKFFEEDWFAGGFLWKWYAHTSRHGGRRERDYTPQGKVAEAVVRNWYGKVQE